ncbi:hypothetical protein [Flavobacterium sp. N3904]|uniref:hypothetical protein n=1 Tax=Flavobacterium sp. N3904 TaxID=2986835 RepID=UPI002224A03F|nr:hypothetical protein [Flavobacterium sp. N3904]
MKNRILILLVLITSLFGFTAFSQNEQEPESLGLPGDNLNLYAVLDIFQNSKTIEDFEKSLNEENTKINNLDLDNDGKVDFIKVTTKKDGENFMFILQDEVAKNDIQDIAVVFVNKDKDKRITVQVVGDENLYGKNYVVEPVTAKTTSSTINPGYNGSQTVTTTSTTTTVNVVNVATSPVVVYLYSPVYVPYYPPYYYGYYPSYFRPWAPIYFSVYYHNHYHYHNHYYRPPYYHYPPHYAHYSSNRNTSVVVVNNTRNGNYKGTYNGNNYRKPTNPTTRPSTRPSTRPTSPSAKPETRPSKPSTRPETSSSRPSKPTERPVTPSTRPVAPTTRPSTPSTPSTRPSTPSTKQTNTYNSNRQSTTKQSTQRSR